MKVSKDMPELEMIESPCIGNCCLNEKDICLGCYRSLTEITSWAAADNNTRLEYLENTAERKVQKSQGIYCLK